MSHVTIKFMITSFFVIVIYDIFAKIWSDAKAGKFGIVTVTSIFRLWYDDRPLVPFMVSSINWSNIPSVISSVFTHNSLNSGCCQ